MYYLVIGLIIFVCVLLVLVVLAQNSKGGGLSSQFGGSGASNLIGVKKTGDLLEKLTWSFITAIFVLSLSTSFMIPGQSGNSNEILDRAGQEQNFNFDTPLNNQSESAPADQQLQQDLQVDSTGN